MLFQYLSKSDLKLFNDIDGASIISDGKLFHMLAILQEKIGSSIVVYWILENLVLMTSGGGMCISEIRWP